MKYSELPLIKQIAVTEFYRKFQDSQAEISNIVFDKDDIEDDLQKLERVQQLMVDGTACIMGMIRVLNGTMNFDNKE